MGRALKEAFSSHAYSPYLVNRHHKARLALSDHRPNPPLTMFDALNAFKDVKPLACHEL